MIHKDHKWLISQLTNYNLTLDETFLATFDSVHQFRGHIKNKRIALILLFVFYLL